MPIPLSSNCISYIGLKGFALNYMGHWSCPYLISNRWLGQQDADMVWGECIGQRKGVQKLVTHAKDNTLYLLCHFTAWGPIYT